jgi:predicted kinase
MTADSPAQTHPKNEVIVLTGIPGSGKSTLVRERFPKYKRINLDTLKTRGREASEILFSLERLESIIVDNTNTTRQGRKKYIEIARAYGVTVRSIYLDTPLAIALRRNALRKGKERIPNGAIARFQRIIEPPSLDEGFDSVEVIHALQNIEEKLDTLNRKS